MGGRMSKEGIATFKNVSMGSLCDPRKQEEILSDLWLEWVKLVLELELENAVRRRFPGHSEGTYGRLARLIDQLGFIGADVRFQVERLWRGIVCWFAAGSISASKLTATVRSCWKNWRGRGAGRV
jgi:hypothetical protein